MKISFNALFALALAITVVMLPEASYSLGSTVGRVLCNLNEAATGTAGKGIATLAVVFVGIGAFFGKASWGLVLLTAVGIALVFGGSAIANAVSGSGSCLNQGSLANPIPNSYIGAGT